MIDDSNSDSNADRIERSPRAVDRGSLQADRPQGAVAGRADTGADRLRHHRRRRSCHRSHRIFCTTPIAQQFFTKFRALPWSILRPLTVWHRDKRQDGVPVRRRETRSRRYLDSGGNSRHVLRRQDHWNSEWPGTSCNHRLGGAPPPSRYRSGVRKSHCILRLAPLPRAKIVQAKSLSVNSSIHWG